MTSNQDADQIRHPITGAPMDAAFKEILDSFVGELPNRIEQLERAVAESDIQTVRTMSHQLKGCAAGYGFDELGVRAAELEESLRQIASESSGLTQLRAEIDGLVALCRSYCDGQ
ncbi:MAG: Hpt domain-containing protein [Planctomycetota bacterium]